jgi:hypothetical protein
VPVPAWVALGFFLAAASFLAVHMAMASKDASLSLKVQHSLRSAQLSVWVDGDIAYSGKLQSSAKKKFGLFEQVQGSLTETVPVSAGVHQIRVSVASDDGSVQENVLSGEFTHKSQRTLSVVARRDNVSLSWLGGASPVPAAPSSASSLLQTYASTLLLTAAGSIISALTGYGIRELPKHIASRVSETPKA